MSLFFTRLSGIVAWIGLGIGATMMATGLMIGVDVRCEAPSVLTRGTIIAVTSLALGVLSEISLALRRETTK